SKELSRRNAGLHPGHKWIKWIQSNRTAKVVDRLLWLAEVNLCPTADKPCGRYIGIKGQSPIDHGSACFSVATGLNPRPASPVNTTSVVVAQLCCSMCESFEFGHVFWRIVHPARELSPDIAPSRQSVSRSETRV